MEYKIIVDSCCDMTPEMREDSDFISVPLTISFALQTAQHLLMIRV